MDYSDNFFEISIDKGTLDSILCGENSTLQVQKALTEVSRVLKPGGAYVCISHGQPSYRLTYLQRPEYDLDVSIATVKKPILGGHNAADLDEDDADSVHYIYTCVKNVRDEETGETVPV